MLHLLAMLFFSGAAAAALTLMWRLIGREWDAVERALGIAGTAQAPCPAPHAARVRVRQVRRASVATPGWRAAA